MEEFPSLCAGATCAQRECCQVCPFAGFWQSTNVFGGDALQVSAPGSCIGFDQDVTAGTFVHMSNSRAASDSDRACSLRCAGTNGCTAWVRQPSTGTCWLTEHETVSFQAVADRNSGLRCDTIDTENEGWRAQIVSMPFIQFAFEIKEGCGCEIALDALTLATGQMSDKQDSIAWDTILNNDVWIQGTQVASSDYADRRLDAKRNYEIRDSGIVVFAQDRRLQQQDVRADYEIQTASAAEALVVTGLLRELTLEEIEAAFNDALSEECAAQSVPCTWQVGSVYQMSDPETLQEVMTGSTGNITSGATMSSELWTLVPVLAMVAAM